MDFFTEERINPSASRLDALRNVGRLVSTALERVDQQARIDQAKKDLEAKVNQLMKVARAAAEGDLTVAVERPRRRRHGPAGRGPGRDDRRPEERHRPGRRVGQPVRRGLAGRRRERQLPERVGPEPGGDGRGDVGLDPAALAGDRRDQPERRRRHAAWPRRPRSWPSRGASRSSRRSRRWS